MMRSKRLLAVAASAAMIPVSLAACSTSGTSAGTGSSGTSAGAGSQPLTIEDTEAVNFNPLYLTCAKKVDAELTINHVPSGDVTKALQQAASKTLPDVLELDNPVVQQFAAAGVLSPLSNYGVSGQGNVPGVTAAGSYKGSLYGLVPDTNSIALYYNVKLLKAAGVTPPTTWDQLRADARKLTHGSTYGFAMANISSAEGTWQFLPFFWSNGGDEKNIATSQAAQALQFIVDLQNDGSMSKSSVGWGQVDVNNQFIGGKAAMMVNGPWQLPALNAAKGLDFASVKIPTPSTSQKTIAPLGGSAYTVPNTGDKGRMALAGKFVGCINSAQMQTAIAGVGGNVPSNEAVAATWASSHPQVASFVTTVKTARARTGELGSDWPKAETKIYTAEQLALTGKASPSAALSQAKASN